MSEISTQPPVDADVPIDQINADVATDEASLVEINNRKKTEKIKSFVGDGKEYLIQQSNGNFIQQGVKFTEIVSLEEEDPLFRYKDEDGKIGRINLSEIKGIFTNIEGDSDRNLLS